MTVGIIFIINGHSFGHLAEDYATATWTCQPANMDTGSYKDANGVIHNTNPLGHTEYTKYGRRCDWQEVKTYTGIPYGYGHWDTIDGFRSNLTAGKGAGNHKDHYDAIDLANDGIKIIILICPGQPA